MTQPVRVAAVLLFAAFAGGAFADDQPEPYRLGEGDLLQITTPGQPELSGKFRISPGGSISYPLAGEVVAAGRSPVELIAALRERLAERIPMRAAPAIEVAEYAPVFVAGEVEKPGQYAFRPGMVALELLSLAGGVRRAFGALDTRVVQMINAEQEAAERRSAIFGDLVRRRRIEAELANSDFEPRPQEVKGDGSVPEAEAATIARDEKALFDVRRRVMQAQQAALRDQIINFDNEIVSLRQGLKLHSEEIRLLELEVANSQKLFDKGLGVLPALLALKRQLSATRRDSLDLDAYLARAQQRRLEVEQKIQEIANLQARENAKDLRELNVTLAQNERKLAAALAVLSETRAEIGKASLRPRAPVFRIARRVDGVFKDMAVDEFAALRPRDILRVERTGGTRPSEVSSLYDSTAPR